MPGTPRLLPNVPLRRERQRRGWSREYVAEQIGVADPKTIGRWERGVAFPSVHFRQKLCDLFDLPARSLGLGQKDADEIAQAALEVVLTSGKGANRPSASLLFDPMIPPSLTDTAGLVGREDLLHRLKERLCAEKGPRIAALDGLPGVGKTVLAVEFVNDADIQQYFCEGILWVSLGTRPDVLALLRRWATLLRITHAGMKKGTGAEDWASAIRAAIGSRRMLLVIDDAWSSAEARAFKVGGPNCSYLLTTRVPSLALDFAGDGAMSVCELGQEDSMKLLASLAPDIVRSEPDMVRALTQAVGGLPLALTLMGRYLQSRAYSSQLHHMRA